MREVDTTVTTIRTECEVTVHVGVVVVVVVDTSSSVIVSLGRRGVMMDGGVVSVEKVFILGVVDGGLSCVEDGAFCWRLLSFVLWSEAQAPVQAAALLLLLLLLL
jgi:hypothetical protein